MAFQAKRISVRHACGNPPAGEHIGPRSAGTPKRSRPRIGSWASSPPAWTASAHIDPARPGSPRGRDPPPHDAAAIAAVIAGAAEIYPRAAPPSAPVMVLMPTPIPVRRSGSGCKGGGAECRRCDGRESKLSKHVQSPRLFVCRMHLFHPGHGPFRLNAIAQLRPTIDGLG